MPLSPLLTYSAEAPNGTIYLGTLTDATVYGSGNPDFADTARYITGNKLTQTGTVDTAVTINSFDPKVTTDFTFDVPKDGHYQFVYIIADDWAAGSYVTDDIVWYVPNAKFYRTPSATSAEPSASPWIEITDPTSFIGGSSEPGNVVSLVKNVIIYPFSKKAYGDASEDAALEGCNDCERGEDVKTYEYLGVLVDGMNVANQRSKFTKGEKMARKAQEIAATL
jgi:hypothetical protein